MQRIRLLVICFLLTAYLGVALRPLWVHLGFVINQQLIAREFCINSARPEMKCEGKCYLRTKLIEMQTRSIAEKPHVAFQLAPWETLPHQPEQAIAAFHTPTRMKNHPPKDVFRSFPPICRSEFHPPELNG